MVQTVKNRSRHTENVLFTRFDEGQVPTTVDPREVNRLHGTPATIKMNLAFCEAGQFPLYRSPVNGSCHLIDEPCIIHLADTIESWLTRIHIIQDHCTVACGQKGQQIFRSATLSAGGRTQNNGQDYKATGQSDDKKINKKRDIQNALDVSL